MPATARLLDIDLPQRQSAFLWGAGKTGKSTYLSWSSVASPSRAVSSSVMPGGIRIVPWQIFRSRLWAGEIIA